MGVFTVGRQVSLEILMPGWWLSGAAVDMDLRNGRYYDSANPNTVSLATDFLSCIRTSVGYAKNADGTLTQFASNALRIGTGTGLIVENARTNLVSRSQEFDNAYWNKTGATVTADQAVAPDGTTTMDKFDEGAGTSQHQINRNETYAGAQITFSVFLKDIDRRYAYIAYYADNGSMYAAADLQTGTITASGILNNVNTTFTSASIEAFANGIYRLSLTGTPNSSGTNVYSSIYLSNTATPTPDAFADYSYTGSNKSIYVWGAQLEVGSFASSYFPTTTASAGRAADAVSCTGSLDTLLKASARTSLVDIIASATPVTWDIISGSTAGNELIVSSSDVVITSNTATKSFSGSGAFTTGVKVGAGTSGSSTSVTGAGLTVATGSSGTANTGTVYLGSDSTNFWYGYIRRATFWNSKLADATLQGFTNS